MDRPRIWKSKVLGLLVFDCAIKWTEIPKGKLRFFCQKKFTLTSVGLFFQLTRRYFTFGMLKNVSICWAGFTLNLKRKSKNFSCDELFVNWSFSLYNLYRDWNDSQFIVLLAVLKYSFNFQLLLDVADNCFQIPNLLLQLKDPFLLCFLFRQ